MLIAVLADIHGDLPALEAALADAAANRSEQLLVLGDIIEGPNSAECIDVLRARAATVVPGNHEAWRMAPESIATRMASVTGNDGTVLSPAHLEWLGSLPLIAWVGNVSAVHASFHRPERWTVITDATAARRSFANQPTEIAFAGHTHEAGFWIEGASAFCAPPESGTLRPTPDRRYLINPGAVGRVFSGRGTADYLLFDDTTRLVRWRRVPLS